MNNVIDLSNLRKTEPAAEPELAEEIAVQTFRLPLLAQPAPRISLAVVELTDLRRVDLSMHQEGLCLFFEATGEQTRVLPVEAILKGWLPVFVPAAAPTAPDCKTCDGLGDVRTGDTIVACPDCDTENPVAARLEADRVTHAADEAAITLEPTP